MTNPSVRTHAPLALSTFMAFASLAAWYSWAWSELVECRDRAGMLLEATGYGEDYNASILTLASVAAFVIGLSSFVAAAGLGIGRRPGPVTALFAAPVPVWLCCWVIGFSGLSEEFFP
jgi:hypothetical protein